MSIYATQWVLRFPATGDEYDGCEWVEVICQGVPAHIGNPAPGYGYEEGDPYASFLPPVVPLDESADDPGLRAVVIVRDGTEKAGQEYIGPLLVLSGQEYAEIPFPVLHRRICDALRGDRPPLVMQVFDHGRHLLMFEDGSVQVRGRAAVIGERFRDVAAAVRQLLRRR